MADQQVGSILGLPVSDVGDADSASNLSGTNNPQGGFSDGDMNNITNMRNRLAGIDATYYTTARLDQMSYNDMVYAIRVNDHPSTIKQ